MNLKAFREIAECLSNRKKEDITITFNSQGDGEMVTLKAKYDPMFKTVELASATVPAKELRHWLMLLYGANSKTVNITY